MLRRFLAFLEADSWLEQALGAYEALMHPYTFPQ